MANVNRRDDPSAITPSDRPNRDDEEELASWVRWWHWLIFTAVLIGAFLYYPLWRFEQKWQQLQVGDSIDRVQEIMGELGEPSYTVQGGRGSSTTDGFVFTRYWKHYELQIARDTRKISAKTVVSRPTAPNPAASSP